VITLGIGYQMHDSSACVARDGEIVVAIAEERVSRLKHDARFPVNAIRACLDFARVKPEELDFIAFGWPSAGRFYRHDLACFARGKYPLSTTQLINSTRHFVGMWHQAGGLNRFRHHFGPVRARPIYIDHHLAHAISAYAFSGFDEATVVVVDGRGAHEATTVWHARDGRLEPVSTIPFPNSLGLFYAEFTYYLGFEKYSDEWKVMGLAPYGGPGVNLRNFIVPDDAPYWVDSRALLGRNALDVSAIEARLGPKRAPEGEIDERVRNISWAVQDACEQAMETVVRMAVEKTRCRNLCLAGGVALNSKANGKLAVSGIVDNIFVQPAAADDGVALGAALAPHLENGGALPVRAMRNAYLGLEFTDAEIESVLRAYKIRYTRVSDPAVEAAERLAAGKILGWFQGRMEFGPRALGSRSILADPRDPEMKDKVNNAVKFREAWRPFAPSLLKEAAAEYLLGVTDSPFMILTAEVREEKRSVIPAVTHADHTARPQTVEREVNPLYYKLIAEFAKRTGVPVIMNTSFNLRGEAIVNSPTDAIRTFYISGLDTLVIGNFVVEK
jgi:carbamoyltransferase